MSGHHTSTWHDPVPGMIRGASTLQKSLLLQIYPILATTFFGLFFLFALAMELAGAGCSEMSEPANSLVGRGRWAEGNCNGVALVGSVIICCMYLEELRGLDCSTLLSASRLKLSRLRGRRSFRDRRRKSDLEMRDGVHDFNLLWNAELLTCTLWLNRTWCQ